MKLISWNVNGLRAIVQKGFAEIFDAFDADVVALQEVKLQEGQLNLTFPGYQSYWHYAERKGYSGVAVYSRVQPLGVWTGIGNAEFDTEGRCVTLEFEPFYVVAVYTPNAQDGLRRLDYRLRWEDKLRAYLTGLKARKGVLLCGDLNVAHEEIDLANPDANHQNPGFSDEERGKFRDLLAAGFVDTFRHFHPDQKDAYSWWSYRTRARERNVGWRIDYFLASRDLEARLESAGILSDVQGSDHCPVCLQIAGGDDRIEGEGGSERTWRR